MWLLCLRTHMRTTVSLPDELAAHVDAVRPSDDASDAEAVRECIRRSQRLNDVQADLRDAEARITELQNQLQAVNQRTEEHQELVRYVEQERELQQRQEARQSAPVWRRAKWWIFGTPNSESQTYG